MFDRRVFMSGLAVLGVSGLAGCSAGGGARVTLDSEPRKAGGSPNLAELMKEGPLGDKALGQSGAPVTIVEYVSLTCPYSRKFHLETYPKLKREYIDQGKVRFVMREFPIGRSAAAAAVVTRAAPDKIYFALYEKFLLQQKEWTSQEVRPDAIYKIAAQVGMSRDTFDSNMADQTIIKGLVWVKQRGREFGVSGTPTFFINGKKNRGALSYEEIAEIIDPALSSRV